MLRKFIEMCRIRYAKAFTGHIKEFIPLSYKDELVEVTEQQKKVDTLLKYLDMQIEIQSQFVKSNGGHYADRNI